MGYNKKSLLIHIAIWVIYWGIEFLLMYLTLNSIYLWESIPSVIIHTLQFYLIIKLVLNSAIQNIEYRKVILKLISLCIIVLILKAGVLILLEKLEHPHLQSLDNFKQFLIATIYRFTTFSIYAGFIWFFTTRNHLSKILLEKELEEQKLQNKLLIAEKATLQAKINPHFLFNTLNFIYSKAALSSDEIVSKTILLLSDVLRYSLNASDNRHTVSLNKEIAHLNKLIEINKLRFNNNFYFNIWSTGEAYNKELPPFILLTLFENALKHGDFQNPSSPISFSITQSKDKIVIQTTNLKKMHVINENEGFNIGISYIENILVNFFGENYSLNIQDSPTDYKLTLSIITND